MADPVSYIPTVSLADKLALTCRVIIAIVLRETKTRFGRNKLGFLWALIEPIVYIGVFIAIRSVTRDHIPFGQDFALFIVSGLLTLRTFSAIANRGMGAITSNKALLAYPPVKPLDLVIARTILESLTMGVVWMIFLSILAMTSEEKIIFHPDVFAQAIAALIYLASSVALLHASLAAVFPAWERIWGLTRLPLLLMSAIFYVPKLMPPWFQSILYWNPILHCAEWVRTGIYLTYEPLLDVRYLLCFSTLTLCIGLMLEQANRPAFTN